MIVKAADRFAEFLGQGGGMNRIDALADEDLGRGIDPVVAREEPAGFLAGGRPERAADDKGRFRNGIRAEGRRCPR